MAGCGDNKTLVMTWMLVGAKSATPVFVPAGGWVETGNFTVGKSQGEMRGKVNTLNATPCVQYANDPRSPSGTLNIGGTLSADGMLDPTTVTDVSAIRAYRMCRQGWSVAGDGTNIAVAMVSGAVLLAK